MNFVHAKIYALQIVRPHPAASTSGWEQTEPIGKEAGGKADRPATVVSHKALVRHYQEKYEDDVKDGLCVCASR